MLHHTLERRAFLHSYCNQGGSGYPESKLMRNYCNLRIPLALQWVSPNAREIAKSKLHYSGKGFAH